MTILSEIKPCYCETLSGGHDPNECAAFEAMREALREAADYMGEMGHPESILDKARAALALADKVAR